jgi:hypothetical protein
MKALLKLCLRGRSNGAAEAPELTHVDYLAAGGIHDIFLGDGALSYSGERILETY